MADSVSMGSLSEHARGLHGVPAHYILCLHGVLISWALIASTLGPSWLWTNIFIIMLLVLCLSEDKPVQAEVLMYLYVFSILNDFLNLVIWGPWDRETSTMRFSLTMAALNLIIKPFLTPAMLELVKRNGSGASGAGFPGGSRVGYNPIGGGGMGGPPGPPPAGYPGGPPPYSAGPYGGSKVGGEF